MSAFKKLLFLIILVLIGGGIFVWSGVFNVAANDKHWDITTEILEIARDRSVATRAADIVAPDLTDNERIERGAANYDAMCVQCHLAPGVESSELYEGLYPKPPVLYKDNELADEAKEVFWIIKNGIKMTGMPAWGINNSDEQIWDMIALITVLDELGEEGYKKLVDSGEHTHKGGGHDDDSMMPAAEDGEHADENEAEGHESIEKEKTAEKSNSKDHNADGHSH